MVFLWSSLDAPPTTAGTIRGSEGLESDFRGVNQLLDDGCDYISYQPTSTRNAKTMLEKYRADGFICFIEHGCLVIHKRTVIPVNR